MNTLGKQIGINGQLLLREASMSSMEIGIGLTNIRRYDFVQVGFFYSGIHSITIGIERLLKIIFIYDFQLRNVGKYPNNFELRQFGHKIVDLINKAIEIDISQALNCNGSFLDQDDIYSKIIDFLSDFAIEGRYFNLDYLTGNLQTNEEPLMRWDREICSEIMKRHYRSLNKKKFKERKMDIEGLENNAYMIFFKESGNEINDLSTFFDYGDKVSTKQKYSVFYIYQIIHYLLNVCSELETKGHFFPFLSEFYKIFGIEDKKIVLRKKSWNPVPPFYF